MVKSSNWKKVAKHYMEDPEFEVDHHRDTKYPVIEPHYHEFYEMLYFVSGHVDYIIQDEVYHLQSGDLLVIPPNILHNPVFYDFEVPYERYVLWVSLHTIHCLIDSDPGLGYFLSVEAPRAYLLRRPSTSWGHLGTIFVSLEEATTSKAFLYRAQGKAILLHVLVEYNRALIEGSESAKSGCRGTLLTNILHYIQINITGPLSLDIVASAFYIDKYNLSHLFKEKMGISYYQYILQQRLLLGKKMILDGIPATRVCTKCGFHDYSSFYRAFCKEYGLSPSVFKKQHENH